MLFRSQLNSVALNRCIIISAGKGRGNKNTTLVIFVSDEEVSIFIYTSSLLRIEQV